MQCKPSSVYPCACKNYAIKHLSSIHRKVNPLLYSMTLRRTINASSFSESGGLSGYLSFGYNLSSLITRFTRNKIFSEL